MNREFFSLVFAVLFVPSVILIWLQVMHLLRMRQVRSSYQRLTVELCRQILNHIDAAGRGNRDCTVLVATELAEASRCTVSANSHYGGLPYAEVGDVWPISDARTNDPADFLIQLRLDELLPPPWAGRLVVVFNRYDAEQTVRCYATPTSDRAVSLQGGPAPQREWNLQPVQIPRQSLPDDPQTGTPAKAELLSYDPVVLLDEVPELLEPLSQLTRRPADLLAAILAPNHCGYGFSLSDIVQVGGNPVWLFDDPGDMDCPVCNRPMRFLFQFGDLNGGPLLGKAGVCYVFGCNEHPDSPRGIVQLA